MSRLKIKLVANIFMKSLKFEDFQRVKAKIGVKKN